MVEVKFERIKGLDYEIGLASGPPDDAITSIHKAKGEVGVGQQVAEARMVAGPKHWVYEQGFWVGDFLIRTPSWFTLAALLEYSPFISNPSRAMSKYENQQLVQYDRQDAESLYQIAEEDASKQLAERRAHNLPTREGYSKSIAESPKDDLIQATFNDPTVKYCTFLQKNGVMDINVFLKKVESEEPIAYPIWLHAAHGNSAIDGAKNFHMGSKVFSVRPIK